MEEYIASGVLEAYVAGELDEKQMLEVDRMARQHPAVKAELDDLFLSIRRYAEASGQRPPQQIVTQAMEVIKEEEKEAFIRAIEEPQEEKIVIQRVNTVPIWSIAASILFFVSLGFNFYFFSRIERDREMISELAEERTLLADQVETTNQTLEEAKTHIEHLMDPNNIHIRMDGVEVSPESYASVFWNKNSNAVFISVDNLPAPPHGHQYQLWAIKEGQAPIDAGIFDHSYEVQQLKTIRGDVLAFAVTLEKEGGTPIATVENTFVKGFL